MTAELVPFDLVAAGLRLMIIDLGDPPAAGPPSGDRDRDLALAAADELRTGDPSGLGAWLGRGRALGDDEGRVAEAAFGAGALGAGTLPGGCLMALVPVARLSPVRTAVTTAWPGSACPSSSPPSRPAAAGPWPTNVGPMVRTRWMAAAMATLAVAVLVGCSDTGGSTAGSGSGGTAGGSGGTAGGGTATTVGGGQSDPAAEAKIEQAFRGYNQKLVDRDFDAACQQHAPETTVKLLENVRAQGVVAANCVEALTAIYSTPGAAELADGITATIQISDIAVDGDKATITWSAEVSGNRITPSPSTMRLIDGEWKIVDIN